MKKLLLLFFVALFVGDYINDHFFFHSHIVDGVTIVHSHMHSGMHHNSQNDELAKQNNVLFTHCDIFTLTNYCCFSAPTQIQIQKNEIVQTAQRIASIYLINISLRAPPVV